MAALVAAVASVLWGVLATILPPVRFQQQILELRSPSVAWTGNTFVQNLNHAQTFWGKSDVVCLVGVP
jgi:hypothetical protein